MIPMEFKQNPTINWQSENPVLKQGQVGYDTTTKRFKFGDGKTPWNSLTDSYEKAGSSPSLLSTTIVQTEITAKQNLYTVPVGKKCVVTLIILRDGTPALNSYSGDTVFGYDADAGDFTASSDRLGELSDNSRFIGITSAGRESGYQSNSSVGSAGQIFGCAMGNGTATPGTLKIDVFGYLIDV